MGAPLRWSRPLVDDLEIYRCAKVLMDRHGERATTRAAQNEGVMLAKGDAAGVAVWQRIRKAIAEIERAAPKAGEPVH